MSSVPSHLCLLLDLSPVHWHALSQLDPPLSLHFFLSQVLIFLNAHLALKNENTISVFGAFPGRSIMLYPQPSIGGSVYSDRADENTFHVFRTVDDGLMRRIKEEMDMMSVVEEDEPVGLVGALTKSLCYINRISNPAPPLNPSETPAAPPHSRILVLSVSPDVSTAYIPLMNSIFSAQKLKVIIDVCKLDASDTIFLHQASHLTGGAYIQLGHRDALLQYLSMCFLSEPETRQSLAVPSQDKVDFRAACFCHKEIVDIGYVCSVCLSIFCKPVEVCSTCRTRFSVRTLQRFGMAGAPNGNSSTNGSA